MKNILIILVLYFSFSSNLYSQKDKNKDITEAISFLNIFLNEENWAMKTTGGFTYNNYFKTLEYKSKSILDGDKQVIDVNFILSLNNVISIKEKIHKADKNNTADSNIMSFDILLKDEIYRSLNIRKKNDVIPDYTNEKVKKVWFAIEKQITDENIESIKLVIRDVFQNIPIETEYF